MIVKTYSVFCNGDARTCHGWIAQTTEGLAAARKEARQHGWAYMGRGVDLCPVCKEAK